MWKVNFCVIVGLACAHSVALRDHNTRRISPSQQKEFFLSGLYNKKGKRHDLGSDFGLTSDVYTKLNPFYTKNLKTKPVSKKPEPFYYPVYNHSVTQDVPSSDETYDHPPSSYDSKTNYVSSSYSAPSNSYGAPSSSYGAPSSSYGAPSYSVQSVQSVPSTSYGSPGVSSYYPSSSYGPSPSYGPSFYHPSPPMPPMPEAQKSHSEFFLSKIMKKFDLILMSKILLKLIIFKKIVKFIGIICLLMFIPILKKKFEEHTSDGDEDEERRIKELDAYANVDFRVKEIANFALTAVEGFEHDNIPWCVGESVFYCRLQYMLDNIDLRYPGTRILSLWFPKLQTTTTSAPSTTDALTSTTQRNFDEGTVDFNDSITESSDMESIEEDSNEEGLAKFNEIFHR